MGARDGVTLVKLAEITLKYDRQALGVHAVYKSRTLPIGDAAL